MLKIADLKKFLKDNDIKFYSYWNKKKLVEVAKKHKLYPKEEEIKKDLNKIRNYDRLKNIAKNPKKVTIKMLKLKKWKHFHQFTRLVSLLTVVLKRLKIGMVGFGMVNIELIFNNFIMKKKNHNKIELNKFIFI